MQIPIWTLVADNDEGTEVSVFTNECEAYAQLFTRTYQYVRVEDRAGQRMKRKARKALTEERYLDLADIVDEDAYGSGDYYSVYGDSVEVPSPFTPRELATILHGLRCAQNYTEPGCDHFTDEVPLTPDEIDSLCERINLDLDGSLSVKSAE